MHRISLRATVRAVLSLTAILALSMGLWSTASAQGKKPIAVGKQVVAGMSVAVELEEPKQMQMKGMGQMGGMGGSMAEWKTFRPKAGALTHHLTVILAVPATGERIPYADVSATIINRADKAKVEKELPAMFGDKLIYGTNVFLKPGNYDLILSIGPPALMRVEDAINKWLQPIQAKFGFEVK